MRSIVVRRGWPNGRGCALRHKVSAAGGPPEISALRAAIRQNNAIRGKSARAEHGHEFSLNSLMQAPSGSLSCVMEIELVIGQLKIVTLYRALEH